MGARASRWAVAAGMVVGCLVSGGDAAIGATGALSAGDCLSGDAVTATACLQAPGANSGGEESGLDELQSVDVSPDGTSVYVTSQSDNAITHLQRNATTGALTFAGCITGTTAVTGCTPLASATANGALSGLSQPSDLVISNNGQWLYATASADAAVLRFSRNTTTGALTFVDCVTANTGVVPACTATPTAVLGGGNTGLDEASGIALSPGGTSLYVTSSFDDAVSWFDRDTGTGAITYDDCISAETATNATACDSTPDATANGDATGLESVFSPAVSDDGDAVYVASNGDAAVTWFNRAPGGGLTWNDCITGDLDSGPLAPTAPCSVAIPSATATPEGANSGMERTQALAISPDDGSLYSASQTDASVVQFTRNPANEDLSFDQCLTGESNVGGCTAIPTATALGGDSGMNFAQAVAISPDGKSVYVAGAGDAAVNSFRRDLGNGSLTWQACLTGETATVSASCVARDAAAGGTGSGLEGIRSLAVTSDGLGLLAAAANDATASWFVRSNAPETTLGTSPPALTNDATPSFTFSADETPVTFQCRIDGGGFGPCSGTGTHTTAALADGIHTFQVRARNDVPTPDPTPASVIFTVDATAPETTITSGPEAAIAGTSAEFAFTADGATGFACRIDGGAFAACTSPKALSGLAEGSHTFEVRASDAAGNADASPASRSFSVDTSAPTVDLTKKPKKKLKAKRGKSKAKAKFVFSSEPGAGFECSKDKGKGFKPCTSPYKKAYKKGKHTVSIRAVDAVGNAGPAVVTKFKVKLKR